MRRRNPVLDLLATASLVAFAACSRNVVPDGEAAATPMPAPAPAQDDFALAPAHDVEAPIFPATAPEGEPIASGTVRVAPTLAGKVAPGDMLYIIARPSEGGRPLAIKRVANPAFPVVFSLTNADNPMGGAGPTGPMSIRAKIDKDGDAMSNTAGDLDGMAKDVAPGTQDVGIVIDHEVESAE